MLGLLDMKWWCCTLQRILGISISLTDTVKRTEIATKKLVIVLFLCSYLNRALRVVFGFAIYDLSKISCWGSFFSKTKKMAVAPRIKRIDTNFPTIKFVKSECLV